MGESGSRKLRMGLEDGIGFGGWGRESWVGELQLVGWGEFVGVEMFGIGRVGSIGGLGSITLGGPGILGSGKLVKIGIRVK